MKKLIIAATFGILFSVTTLVSFSAVASGPSIQLDKANNDKIKEINTKVRIA